MGLGWQNGENNREEYQDIKPKASKKTEKITTNLAKNLAMINSGNSKKTYMRVGTWNIRTLSEKEQELVDEFPKANVTLIALTETK